MIFPEELNQLKNTQMREKPQLKGGLIVSCLIRLNYVLVPL